MSKSSRAYNYGKGKTAAWLLAHIDYSGDKCLIWPFCRKQDGRGQLGYKGKPYGAHELMCIFVNGPAPSSHHEVAHSCGNGHGGCVHPKHVSWKTPTENHEDTIRHGNAKKKGFPRRKLSEKQVVKIKLLKGKKTQDAIARLFGVSNTTIAEIHRGRSWQDRPKRHRGTAYPEPQRSKMVAQAARMRAAGSTLEHIANTLGVSRLTARTRAAEGRNP